jgi:hypothetical protein
LSKAGFPFTFTDNVIGVMDDVTGDVAYTALEVYQCDLAEDIKVSETRDIK